MKQISIIFFLFIFLATTLIAQDSSQLSPKLSISGYIKNLTTISFDKITHTDDINELLHNRMNLKWKPKPTMSFTAEFRNRLFAGAALKQNSNFAATLRNTNEAWDLQKYWIDNKTILLHTNIERLYMDVKKVKWNARIGRQRVNWGIATTWNPNDIFNTYNFLDFDYEERPGTDGIKVQYLSSYYSNIELVYSQANKSQSIAAAKYFMNRWKYDFQFIAGTYKGNTTIGMGWAGNIKDAGFKGELQYYFNKTDSLRQLNMTTSIDYIFNSGWYVSAGALYNSTGINTAVNNWNAINLNLSAKNLMPAMYNFMISTKKEVTPLSTLNMSCLYAPKMNLLILLPSYSYNISDQWDADIIVQSFYLQLNHTFKSVNDLVMIRARYSF